jgi:hypothetical protein
MVKARARGELTDIENQMLTRVPDVAAKLLANIPRLEGVAKIVRYHKKGFDGSGFPADGICGDAIPQGARLLKILSDLSELEKTGLSRIVALDRLRNRQGLYDPQLLASLRALGNEGLVVAKAETRSMAVMVKDLQPGMVLYSNVHTKDGVLIITAGHEMNEMTLSKLHNFESLSGIREPIFVVAPESASDLIPEQA